MLQLHCTVRLTSYAVVMTMVSWLVDFGGLSTHDLKSSIDLVHDYNG